jgi:hypothetical protein
MPSFAYPAYLIRRMSWGVQRSFPDDGIDLEIGSRGVFAATARSR